MVERPEPLRGSEHSAAVNGDHHAVALPGPGHVLLGIRRERADAPDLVVVRGIRARMQQLRHRRHEAVVTRVLERSVQCIGQVRIEDEHRFHSDIVHLGSFHPPVVTRADQFR